MGRGEMQLYMKLMDKKLVQNHQLQRWTRFRYLRLVVVHKWLHDMPPLSTDRLRMSLLQLVIFYKICLILWCQNSLCGIS